jgi:hypothetical protein
MTDLIFNKGNDKILLTKAEYKRAKKRYNKQKSCLGLEKQDLFSDFFAQDTWKNKRRK